jgi:hypothetical protein
MSSLVAMSFFACGGRTQLHVDDEPLVTPGPDASDAPRELGDASRDQKTDVAPDARDGGLDASRDSDAADVRLPTFCEDAGTTLIYLVSAQNDLVSFDPSDRTVRTVGKINCPAPPDTTPFSMAVSRTGTAYVVYTDGNLFRVSTKNASCTPTAFVPNQRGFGTFGMGFSADEATGVETLHIVEPSNGFRLDPTDPDGQARLATIDTKSFALNIVGSLGPDVPRAELTGTGDGKLFGVWLTGTDKPGSVVAEIDKATGAVLSTDVAAAGRRNDGYAFAFWGGAFWLFTASNLEGPSDVHRFDPVTKTTTFEGTVPGSIVGAGVSTCAPL